MNNLLIIVRGGGDLASGVINRLFKSGFDVICLESKNPSAIRRTVSYCSAVYENTATVEEVTAVKCENLGQIKLCLQKRRVPVIVDESCEILKYIRPFALVDAIIAKKNMGTKSDMAPLTIGLGPGFCAGKDVNYVVETLRGHNLGRIISNGCAAENTGVPGDICGQSALRVIHSPCDGKLKIIKDITSSVKKGDLLAYVDETPVAATINGIVRGMIYEGYNVFKGMKIIDIDPRPEERNNCFTISDKARCISGSVLEIIAGSYFKMCRN